MSGKTIGKIIGATLVSLLILTSYPEGISAEASAQTKTTSSTKKKNSTSKQKAANQAKSTKQNSSKKGKPSAPAKQTSKVQNNRRNTTKTPAAPKSSAEAKRMQEAAQRDIQHTKEQLRLNEREIKTGLSDLNRLSSEITAGRKQVEDLSKKVSNLDKEITGLGNQIAENEAQLKLMREEYLKAVKKMRLTKRNQSTLAFVFASENFNQAMRRIRYMRQFSEWKSRKSADIDKKITQLDNERIRLSEAKDEHSEALGQLSKSQAQLEANHKKQETLVASLRKNGDALQAHLVAKQKEANRLKETISSFIAQEQAKAEAERKAREKAEADRIAREKAEAERKAREKAEAEQKTASETGARKEDKKKKTEEKDTRKSSEKSSRNKKDKSVKKDQKTEAPSKPADPAPSQPPKAVEKKENYSGVNFAELKGKLPRPVEGAWRITNPFGRHAMPELPEVEYDNPGIDAEVATGATVKSVCRGKVSGVYKVAGYGTVVIVNHGDYYTVYGNLASTNVGVGTSVASGQSLGTVGPDPDDDRRGSIHFEVWKGREKQNPSSWLR